MSMSFEFLGRALVGKKMCEFDNHKGEGNSTSFYENPLRANVRATQTNLESRRLDRRQRDCGRSRLFQQVSMTPLRVLVQT
jgi:hypothetical protein